MKKNKIGSYLNRNIEIIQLDNYGDLNELNVKNSVLLLYFGSEIEISLNEIDDIIGKIVNLEPLLISISGKKNDIIFDVLLKILSKNRSSHNIMTAKYRDESIDEIVDAFFYSAWPSEEDFDDWTKYSIFLWGNDSDFENFRISIKKHFKSFR